MDNHWTDSIIHAVAIPRDKWIQVKQGDEWVIARATEYGKGNVRTRYLRGIDGKNVDWPLGVLWKPLTPEQEFSIKAGLHGNW